MLLVDSSCNFLPVLYMIRDRSEQKKILHAFTQDFREQIRCFDTRRYNIMINFSA